MPILYLLGGPPRTAKTTILSGLASKLGLSVIAADAIEHGVRNVLTGEPHQMLRNIEFSGSAEWKKSITEGGERKPFTNKGTESELTMQTIIGMLDYYRRNQESVGFEGTAFTPQVAKNLASNGFTVRAAFVGYSDSAHVDAIIAHAKANAHDWINVWLKEEGGGETRIRQWVTQQSEKCLELEAQAKELGFSYFDISAMPFTTYVSSVQDYFLQP